MSTRLELGHAQGLFAASIRAADDRAHPGLLAEIVPGGSLTAEQAVAVYRRGYYARLTEQLGETFEGVWSVLGDEAFFGVCERFIRAHGSDSYNLSDYGSRFPPFLGASPESRELPFLDELASFEWRFQVLFHAREHPHAGPDELAGVEDPRLALGEACFLFAARHAVYDVWKVRRQSPAERPHLRWRRPQHLLAFKRDGALFVRELEEPAFAVLSMLAAGARLSEALERVGQDCPDFDEAAVGRLFRTAYEGGIFSRVL